jgi:hypothetical protein
MSTKREAAYVGIHLQTSRFELFHHPLDCPHKLPICHEFEHLILGGRGLGIDVKAFNGNGDGMSTRGNGATVGKENAHPSPWSMHTGPRGP